MFAARQSKEKRARDSTNGGLKLIVPSADTSHMRFLPHGRRALLRCAPVLAIAALAGVIVPSGALATTSVKEYSTGRGPLAVTPGPDGNVWFTEWTANKVARVAPDGTVVEFGAGITPNAGLADIVAGPDGNLWFTEAIVNRIGRITPSGVVTEFSQDITFGSGLHGIAAGSDGNVWFTEAMGNRIGRITPLGRVTEFPAGGKTGSLPWAITAGPDGNLWFTRHSSAGGVARITTAGVVTLFGPSSGTPGGIAAGLDGNLWLTEGGSRGRIARVTTTGAITEFATDYRSPDEIAAGADGNLYFTDTHSSGALARTTPGGAITELTENLHDAPSGIATATDGTIWFSENGGDRIGRLQLDPSAVTGAATAISSAGATLAGSIGPAAQATTYHFDWGLTTAYGSSTSEASAGSGAQLQPVTAAISGLRELTRYHYRVVATNGSGTTYGQDATFVVPSANGLPPAPNPTAVLPPLARPEFGRTATVTAVSGSVFVRPAHGSVFTRLRVASTVPTGSTIDATKGVVLLTNVRRRGGTLQHGTFWGGAFTVRQAKHARAYTVITLSGIPSCTTPNGLMLAAAMPPKPTPHLWGRDKHGRFITRGSTAVATVRGTVWLTRETCNGTLVKVKRGRVSVRDLVRHRTLVVRAGHRYLARRR